MHQRFQRKHNGGILVLFFVSALVHLLFLVAALPFLSWDDVDEAPEKKLEVRVVDEVELKKILSRMEKRETPTRPLEVKKKKKKPIPLPPTQHRKTVEQDTNRMRPKVASFVSDQDNMVVEETRARKTRKADTASNTLQKAAPRHSHREPQDEEIEASKRGTPTPKNEEKPKPLEGLVRPKTQEAKTFGNPFQKPSLSDAQRVLAKPGFNRRRMEARSGRKLMKNYDKNDRALKASLENFIPEIKPGNHTGVNSHKHEGASYLSHIHRKIHPLWAENYLLKLDLYEPIDSELNKTTLGTKLEFVIDGKTGEVEKITVVKSSGALRFDAEAISIGHQVGPHRRAPKNIISPNGKVYIHWHFWRNQRQCGTFGASIFLMEKDA